ncbi:MAG: 2,3-bisphosphoglycerate-independent phosphoglycerate mutase [Patescibacteria group bacterium]
MNNKKVILCILDGWGLSDDKKHNAIAKANTPNFDYLWNNYPHSELEASGLAVGLPDGQMGNSEVGHLTIGAGRIVYQGLEKINNAFKNNLLENHSLLSDIFKKAKKSNLTIHIKGLFSPGGVHSHSDHFYSFIKLAKKYGISKIVLHIFTDGRDTHPRSAEKFIGELENFCRDNNVYIASLCGRYWAMDRDNNWERTERAYKMLTQGIGKVFKSPLDAIKFHYDKGITDEFIEPSVFENNKKEIVNIKNGDMVFFLNFRADRAKQLAKKFSENDEFNNLSYITMVKYDNSLPHQIIFSDEIIAGGLGEILSLNGKKQLRIAETEKYPHITYFFNGGREEAFDGEDRILIPSNKVSTHDLAPEMKAKEISNEAISAMKNNKYDFILVNFANSDMVGHSGKINETIKAIEAVDIELGRIFKIAQENNYVLIITSDHGNAEKMFDLEIETIHTAHTNNKVPFIIASNDFNIEKNKNISDIALIILKIMGLK